MFCRIIHISTNRADIFTGNLLLGKIDLCIDSRHRIIQIHHALSFQVLITLRGVGAAIDGGVIADELTDTVLRLTGCGKVVIDDGKFVFIQGLIHIRDVPVKHIEKAIILYNDDAVALSQEESTRLCSLIRMAGEYLISDSPMREELLWNLYALFLMDISSILSQRTSHIKSGKRAEELFMDFMQMLPRHFIREHGIGFYADTLGVTPTYLSRVVSQVSGRTVVEFINRLLLMEAIWLLENTPLSIEEIAERIGYADSTTFGRFFFRMKGVTPREYRKSL